LHPGNLHVSDHVVLASLIARTNVL